MIETGFASFDGVRESLTSEFYVGFAQVTFEPLGLEFNRRFGVFHREKVLLFFEERQRSIAVDLRVRWVRMQSVRVMNDRFHIFAIFHTNVPLFFQFQRGLLRHDR